MPPIKITPTLATDILSNLNLLQILQSPRNSLYLFDFLYGIDISSAIWRPNVDAVLKRQAHQCGVDREKDVMRKSLKFLCMKFIMHLAIATAASPCARGLIVFWSMTPKVSVAMT